MAVKKINQTTHSSSFMAGFVKGAYDGVIKAGISAMESNILPDFAVRPACRYLMGQRITMQRKSVDEQQKELMDFVECAGLFLNECILKCNKIFFYSLTALKKMPIAVNVQDANQQHYEVPTEFYKYCLGKRLKYR